MRTLIAIAALGAALLPCASRAADTPPIHVGSIYATRTGVGTTPLVLIPGLACGPWVWDAFVASLPPNAYTIYRVTLAGFDGTPPVPGPRRFDGYASSIVQLIRQQHVARPVLIGHSMGGALALRIGEIEPALPRRLVLVDSFPLFPPLGPGETLDARKTQWQAITAKLKGASDADYAALEAQTIAQMVTDPKTGTDITARTLRSDRASVADSAYELATNDLHPDLGKVVAPTLVLAETGAGYSIEATRQYYQQQYAGAPSVAVDVIANSHHFIMYDQPAAFRKSVLDFIANLK